MSLNIIVAMDPNRVIGKNNNLPWHIPEDLKNFKHLTKGNTVIMGRRTYNSIGRPLPNRHNIVLSCSLANVEGIDICSSLDSALEKALEYERDIFIIGGASVYELAIPLADKMYISYVKEEYGGDTYFPKFNKDNWNIERRENFEEFELVIYKTKNGRS